MNSHCGLCGIHPKAHDPDIVCDCACVTCRKPMLHRAQSSDTVQRNVSTSPVTELREIVACMRELHVSEYQGIKLLPLPSEAPAKDDDTTQRQPTAEDERLKRANVRRVAMASSGGPVPGPRAND